MQEQLSDLTYARVRDSVRSECEGKRCESFRATKVFLLCVRYVVCVCMCGLRER